MSAEPTSVALEATYQIDAVLEMLNRENGRGDFAGLLKAVLPRLIDLNAFVMMMLDPQSVVTPEMMQVVNRWGKAVQS